MPITEAQFQHQRDLITALRSGMYEQGIKALRPYGKNKFCCLGVACDISKLGWWNDDKFVTVEGCKKESATRLPSIVRSYYGWSSSNGNLYLEDISLIELNDEGFTFNQIADIIEARLVLEVK